MGVGSKIERKPYGRSGSLELSKRAVAGFYNLASQMVNMISSQHALFHELPRLPEGFRYKEELLPPEEERALISTFERLPFREFEFRGFKGKRRTVSFGWRYDFNVRELQPTQAIPSFLLALRHKAAEFADLSEDGLQHALITEYSPGAAIGWHKDRPEFDDVIGISLGAPCLFRFRRKQGTRWERASIELQPRSSYLLRGPARWDWQHSIPPIENTALFHHFQELAWVERMNMTIAPAC